jgi:hypothetical protein
MLPGIKCMPLLLIEPRQNNTGCLVTRAPLALLPFQMDTTLKLKDLWLSINRMKEMNKIY